MFTLPSLKKLVIERDLVTDQVGQINKVGIIILHHVSVTLSVVAVLFLMAFWFDRTTSLSWFFLSVSVAFLLIPILARKGFEKTAKCLLLANINISILILSSVFGNEMFIRTFYIPVCGLSILLFEKAQNHLRNIGIAMAVGCYLILDYVVFDQIFLSASGTQIVQGGILAAAFITTWMTFNKFSVTKELATDRNQELLSKTQSLNNELMQKKEELEQHLKELEKVKKKVEKSSRAKSAFLSTMSHEIRTPMNAIIGMTNLLVKGDPREDQMEQLEILDFSAKSLLSLINDVLDFSKIESGKVELESVPFNLKTLLNGVLESFRFTAERKNIQLKLDYSENVPTVIVGDSNRLTQILNNIVGNAVKFTDEGSVTVAVEEIEHQEKKLKLLFAIVDTGVGISRDKQEQIFESFTQERNDASRVFGGTGLGLTISKKLVELQSGEIYLESEKGNGSTFYVELCFTEYDDEDTSSDCRRRTKPESLDETTILLVEDNIVNQKVMSRFLEKWNIDVIVANDGKQALEKIQDNSVNLVLMDLQMPNMDGYEATCHIREFDDQQIANLPVIALTAAALSEVREKIFASGMDDCLTKPFNPLDLREILEYYILEKG